jgi:hypothetical protein
MYPTVYVYIQTQHTHRSAGTGRWRSDRHQKGTYTHRVGALYTRAHVHTHSHTDPIDIYGYICIIRVCMCCVGIKQQIYCTAPVVNRRVILYMCYYYYYLGTRTSRGPPRGWGENNNNCSRTRGYCTQSVFALNP